MSLVIESGVGDGNRLAVFDDKMKEFEVQQSATNYISTSVLEGRTGTFTVRNVDTFTITALSNGIVWVSITNNDPINLMVIDRIYAQFISSGTTLPNPNIRVSVSSQSGDSTVPAINENRFSNIKPIITSRARGTLVGVILSNTVFATLGDLIELIPPNSDAFILDGMSINSINTISNNTLSIIITNLTTSNISFTVEAFIKFMMVPPNQLG